MMCTQEKKNPGIKQKKKALLHQGCTAQAAMEEELQRQEQGDLLGSWGKHTSAMSFLWQQHIQPWERGVFSIPTLM